MLLIEAYSREAIEIDFYIDVVKFIESYFVRRSFEGKEATGIDKVFKPLFKQINLENPKLEDIKNFMNTFSTQKTVSDELFKTLIKEKDIYTSRLGKFILMRLENSLRSTDELTIDDYNKANIDHILPQNPATGSNWNRSIPPEVQKIYKNTWANLVPLVGKLNQLKANKDFVDWKKIIGENAGYYQRYKTTKQILELDNWDVGSIENRSEELIDHALEIWKV
tara:strand:- start:15 stop:683 length:669 start_codon:yes stop_codon:yes gene_type:complete